jgi:AraC-like DNA-binding protein
MNTSPKTGPANAPAQANSLRKPQVAAVREEAIWRGLTPGWRQLYGGFYNLGASIEWHDFEIKQRFEWSRSFHPDSLELCLNLGGSGEIHSSGVTLKLAPATAAFYLPDKKTMKAWRDGPGRNSFITAEFSCRFLQEHLGSSDGALHPVVENFINGRPAEKRFGEAHRLTAAQEQLAAQLIHPPVPQGARALWYQGRLLELMAGFLFAREAKDELFCDRQKRVARERVERVVQLLEENLVEPLSLEEIGRKVGCSSFHLSRTFSAETGTTIPQYLRKLRMERAAAMLQSGKCNVTEAALSVGYSSLSHFSQAFCQTMGCCPGLYPLSPRLSGRR